MNRFLAFTFCFACVVAQIPQRSPYSTMEFVAMNGKRADPCHIGLTAMNTDCPYNRMPDSSNTVLGPVDTSNGQVANFYVTANLRAISITGHNLASVAGVGLSTIGGRCSSTEFRVAVTTATATTVTFNVPTTWLSASLELEENPRTLR
eukprot:NODE_12525_length_507_cov_63.765625_g12234_i0.p1 GENE.NODE_12525_length_507_cov_63.765625_g12234_i0~~NODE_12525_length_507_cov_63.765625_g12234_i0.p1  ORF type:complete len:167 (-),score=45.32 NODE_12525_length_507_cov_63.765625_g12234_i0:5-451(-)